MADALDECTEDLSQLLKLIMDSFVPDKWRKKVKWFITSRPREDIDRDLSSGNPWLILLDSQHVDDAVYAFIRIKVDELGKMKRYKPNMKIEIERKLYEKAQGTFLWVALTCKRLAKVLAIKALMELDKLPLGLVPMYDRMMEQLENQEDKDLVPFCKHIIRSLALAYRPLHITELGSISELDPDLMDDIESLEQLIEQCGSFLVTTEKIVSFLHQSAREYFISDKGNSLFPSGLEDEHGHIAQRSIYFMRNSLKADITKIGRPGAIRDPSLKENDQIVRFKYACLYFVDHLASSFSIEAALNDNGNVHKFLLKHFLHWVEALNLCGLLNEAVLMIEKLQSMVNSFEISLFRSCILRCQKRKLSAFIADARRFLLIHLPLINEYPLQLYSSCIIFSPLSSLIRQQFPPSGWIRKHPAGERDWGPLIQTFESSSSDSFRDVIFSPDGNQIAAVTLFEIMVWDALTGHSLRTLYHDECFKSDDSKDSPFPCQLAFSPDSKRLAWGSTHGSVGMWVKAVDHDHDDSVVPLRVSADCDERIFDIAFAPKNQQLFVVMEDRMEILDVVAGAILRVFKSTEGIPKMSCDGKMAYRNRAKVMLVYDCETETQTELGEVPVDVHLLTLPAFSMDGRWLALAWRESGVKVWDTKTGIELYNFPYEVGGNCCSPECECVALSLDGALVAVGMANGTVWIWKKEEKREAYRISENTACKYQ